MARRDLLRLYTRPDAETRATLADGVLRSLWLDRSTVDIEVVDGVVTLTGHVDRRSTAAVVVAFALGTPGVVDVVDRLTYDEDDSAHSGRLHPFQVKPQDVDIS